MKDLRSIAAPASFSAAVPVWETGCENELNHNLVFRAEIGRMPGATLRITGHTCYLVYVNGVFRAFGPARAAHGFYCVDELQLGGLLTNERNIISVVAAGYNANSYYVVLAPSFLCAEIVDGSGKVIAATSPDGNPASFARFEALSDKRRVRRVQRYAYQRPFVEVYNFGGDYAAPECCHDAASFDRVPLSDAGEKNFIVRGAYYLEYETLPAAAQTAAGHTGYDPASGKDTYRGLSAVEQGILTGFKPDEFDEFVSEELSHIRYDVTNSTRRDVEEKMTLADGDFRVLTFGRNATGLMELTVTAKSDLTLYATFDEIIPESGVPDYTRLTCVNAVIWHLSGGTTYHLLNREPYTMQYLALAAAGGECEISGVRLREIAFPTREIAAKEPELSPELSMVYRAAVETFRQNAADLYMDCPSRERAGWLCDSYFTSQTEFALSGGTRIERAFLANFLLPDHFEDMPDGMLPMCYPSDHRDKTYIPNWAMWYVIELGDYLKRSRDKRFIREAKDRMYALLDFLGKYENSDGLLEKLPSWVFIEWSHSNDLVQDISYPSNMTYAMVLDTMAEMYGDAALRDKAAKLRETIRAASLTDSGFYCDNSVYGEDGAARLSGECTESCQYYAFFSGVATPERDAALWERLTTDFGPQRTDVYGKRIIGGYPEIAQSNTFIGIMLRLSLLRRFEKWDLLRGNIRDYFLNMAQRTGTIWENQQDSASCCHGFASFAAALLLDASKH